MNGVQKPSRGDYRSLYVAILDNDNHLVLTMAEQNVLKNLKLLLGWSGIGTLTPGRIAEVSGIDCTLELVGCALDRLEQLGWIRREGRAIWLVNGLRYEPSIFPSSKQHRQGIQRRVAGLPRCALVDEYRRYYASYFVSLNEDVTSTELPAVGGALGGAHLGGHEGPTQGATRPPPRGPRGPHLGAPDTSTSTSLSHSTSNDGREREELTKGAKADPPPELSTSADSAIDPVILTGNVEADAYFAQHPKVEQRITQALAVKFPGKRTEEAVQWAFEQERIRSLLAYFEGAKSDESHLFFPGSAQGAA